MAKPVYALVGEDSFAQIQELGKILRDLPPDAQRADYDGQTAELADVLDELRSFAMFGGGKVVVVRNGDELVERFREQLEEYLEAPSTSATLVFRMRSLPKTWRIHKFIAKVGEVRECMAPKDVARWAADHAHSAHKAQLTPQAARALVDLAGTDLGTLDTEIAKLAVVAEGQPISPEMVEQHVSAQRQREIKEMTLALASGDKGEALRRWRELLRSDPSAEFRAVTWLGMWLEDVRLFLESPETFFSKAGWKYRGDSMGPFQRTARSIGPQKAGELLDRLVDVDLKSKTGVGDAATNVESFILALNMNG
jgi:DNA polymerase III subunit delta